MAAVPAITSAAGVDRSTLACRLIQRGVRLFLRMLYVRRRREAALRILAFLAHAHNASRASRTFQRLVRCIQTLKVSPPAACAVAPGRCAGPGRSLLLAMLEPTNRPSTSPSHACMHAA